MMNLGTDEASLVKATNCHTSDAQLSRVQQFLELHLTVLNSYDNTTT